MHNLRNFLCDKIAVKSSAELSTAIALRLTVTHSRRSVILLLQSMPLLRSGRYKAQTSVFSVSFASSFLGAVTV